VNQGRLVAEWRGLADSGAAFDERQRGSAGKRLDAVRRAARCEFDEYTAGGS
jgi:hypothetical protein